MITKPEDSDSGSDEEPQHKYCNSLVLPNADDNDGSTFGNVVVSNSSNVHLGPRTYYPGPVTIEKLIYSPPVTDVSNGFSQDKLEGKDNLAFSIEQEILKELPKRAENNNNNTIKKSFKLKSKQVIGNHKQLVSIIITLFVILLLGLSVFAIFLKSNVTKEYSPDYDSDEQNNRTPIESPIDPTITVPVGKKLRLITRTEWLAQPPLETPDKLKLPLPYVIIQHTATEGCKDQATCTFYVKQIQKFHTEGRKWDDIAYNFLVGGDGCAYEGRGWTNQGSHTYGYNNVSIGIAFVGTFNDYLPPERQMIAALQLMQIGVDQGYLKHDYKILAARQLQATQSPGKTFYEKIKTWSHWAPEP